MKLGGWQSGPKRGSRKGLKEYQAMRRARLAELVTRKREQRKGRGRDEDSTLGGDSSLVHSSGLREEIHDVYADPTYHEGDYVAILGISDTRPGIRNIFSYDKEGRVTKVVNGEGEKPNRCIVKLLHEKGSEKVNELYLMPIDYSGSVELTKRKRKQKRYLNGKNVVISSIL